MLDFATHYLRGPLVSWGLFWCSASLHPRLIALPASRAFGFLRLVLGFRFAPPQAELRSNPGTWFTNQTGHMVYVFWY